MANHVLSRTPKPLFPLSSFSSTSFPPSDQPDPNSTVTSILNHHRSKSRWSTVLSLFPSGFTPSQFSQITLQLKNNPHLALRFFLFTKQKSLCDHNLSSYSAIIQILSRAQQPRLKTHDRELIQLAIRTPAMLIYRDMCRKDFRPQSLTVELLIRGLCAKGMALKAFEMMKVVREFGVCPTGTIYEQTCLKTLRICASVAR
ncbi:hypothetical protein like AT2G15980 [Hibiscus trionum]|uniref:Pentatricopeptide repeat-containing protein n=1 Tax=Hibiscus trionum TaxID=183268 RepID=A0A9W7H4Q0_HIBTR|nr:hypothetical protein like AT2G15980 [Hibiscus trionum]